MGCATDVVSAVPAVLAGRPSTIDVMLSDNHRNGSPFRTFSLPAVAGYAAAAEQPA